MINDALIVYNVIKKGKHFMLLSQSGETYRECRILGLKNKKEKTKLKTQLRYQVSDINI